MRSPPCDTGLICPVNAFSNVEFRKKLTDWTFSVLRPFRSDGEDPLLPWSHLGADASVFETNAAFDPTTPGGPITVIRSSSYWYKSPEKKLRKQKRPDFAGELHKSYKSISWACSLCGDKPTSHNLRASS
jgi:hypothetical protein